MESGNLVRGADSSLASLTKPLQTSLSPEVAPTRWDYFDQTSLYNTQKVALSE